MTNQEKVAPTETLCSVLKTTYIVILLVLVYAIFAGLSELHLIQTVLDGGQISEEAANSNDFRQMVVGGIQFLLAVFAFVTFLVWYYRSYNNLQTLYGHTNEYSGGLAIGNFFIPIVSFWRPYKSTKELWSISRPGQELEKGQPILESAFLPIGIWWGLFLIQNYLGQFFLRSLFKEQSLQEIYNLSLMTLGSDILDIPLIVLEMFIVLKITDWQKEKNRMRAFSSLEKSRAL